MAKIPLYNCYWCRCSYCLFRFDCRIKDCMLCQRRDKFKMPGYCEQFIEDFTSNKRLYKEIQKCQACRFKKFYLKIKKEMNEDA